MSKQQQQKIIKAHKMYWIEQQVWHTTTDMSKQQHNNCPFFFSNILLLD